MTIYSNMLPFFIIAAAAGAAYLALVFRRMNRELPLGAAIGAGAGVAGPLLFMVPLQSCTFEPERERIDYMFGLVLFALGAFLIVWSAQWVSRFFLAGENAPSLTSGQTTLGTFSTNLVIPGLLLLPTIVILVFFLYYPLIETFRLSTQLARLGAPRSVFRCTDNFTQFFEPGGFDFTALALALGLVVIYLAYQPLSADEYAYHKLALYPIIGIISVALFQRIMEPDYGEVLFNTFFIGAAIVIFGLILGLAIAYLAYQPVAGAGIYRTLLIWPYAISPAIAGIIFFVIFNPIAGIINHVIELLGGEGPNWITDPWLARLTIIITSVWKTLGYNILFYIAGLQTVPTDLIEAARIDGANAWQRFRNVVIPALSPITFFLIVTNLTYAFFNIFGTIEYMTRGGPAGATSVSIYEIYELGIRSKDLGRAAAQSIVLFIIVIGITWFQFRTTGRRVTYGA